MDGLFRSARAGETSVMENRLKLQQSCIPVLPDFLNNLAKPSLVLSKKTPKETNGKYKEKQRALIKVLLIYSCNLATLIQVHQFEKKSVRQKRYVPT